MQTNEKLIGDRKTLQNEIIEVIDTARHFAKNGRSAGDWDNVAFMLRRAYENVIRLHDRLSQDPAIEESIRHLRAELAKDDSVTCEQPVL